MQHEPQQLLNQGNILDPVLSPFGSNYTFLVQVRNGSQECRAVYKPRKGEVPLWDFPDGTLYKREYAAYLMSEILGWGFIPPTTIRDGPYGIGSLQLLVEHDPRINYFNLGESGVDVLSTIACFDLVANNADRKASHFILAPDGKVWGIDHGLTFHADLKLRTVVGDVSGEPIPEHLLRDLSGLLAKLESPEETVKEFVELLDEDEVAALVQRIQWMLEVREFPMLRPRWL